MSNTIQVPPDSTGKKVDAVSMDVGADTVYRQRIVIADNTGTATFAMLLSAAPAATDVGLVVRNIPSGTQSIVGQVSIVAGTANIGTVDNISATVNVAMAGKLAISGTVSVVIAAGVQNIGSVNSISRT